MLYAPVTSPMRATGLLQFRISFQNYPTQDNTTQGNVDRHHISRGTWTHDPNVGTIQDHNEAQTAWSLWSSPDIRWRRMSWAGHVARIGAMRNENTILIGKWKGRDQFGDLGLYLFPRIRTSGEVLWTRQWTVGFIKGGAFVAELSNY
jgi:hypothetical protein